MSRESHRVAGAFLGEFCSDACGFRAIKSRFEGSHRTSGGFLSALRYVGRLKNDF